MFAADCGALAAGSTPPLHPPACEGRSEQPPQAGGCKEGVSDVTREGTEVAGADTRLCTGF
ncbi:MAG: hypothetical protein FJY65_08300 [Calditrichaeota bacterium]|nr:hypothetical protein [Calditrichota bacterium]